MTDARKLKPCPFCGGVGKLKTATFGGEEAAKFSRDRARQAYSHSPLSSLIHSMFQSGNSIPVDRITITRTQYEQAIK